MYKTISIAAFIITLAVIVLHCIIFRPVRKRTRIPVSKQSLTGIVRKLVYILALLCFLVLGFTGFYPTLGFDEHISGYLLMIHATFAPIFAICLAILAVMWAGCCRFTYNDWPWFQRFVQRVTLIQNAGEESPSKSNRLLEKLTFWLIIFLALPLILSMVLSMLPYFGTHWQELLLIIHRWTALVFAVTAIIHTYILLRTRID